MATIHGSDELYRQPLFFVLEETNLDCLQRPRPIYFLAILAVIALGLLSRRCPHLLPAALGKYPGDALWALMIFLGVGFLFKRSPTLVVALAAFAFSVTIEFTQLYHAPWLDSLRATLPGRLVLGSGFSWVDILAYAIGILLGAATEFVLFRQMKQTKSPRSHD